MYESLVKIPLPVRQNQKLLLQIAETLFDIGTDLLQKKSLDGAVKYLRWSWDYVLQIVRVEGLSIDGRELSVNIRHNLAKAMIRRNAGEELDLDRARELVDGLTLVFPPFDVWLMEGRAKGVLDVSFENGVSGEKGWVSGCYFRLYCPESSVLTCLALGTMIELVDVSEDTFKRYLCYSG
jgi:hypothetical protein